MCSLWLCNTRLMLISSAKTLGIEWWRWTWWGGGLIQQHKAGGEHIHVHRRNPDSSASYSNMPFCLMYKIHSTFNSFCNKPRNTNPTWNSMESESNFVHKHPVWGDLRSGAFNVLNVWWSEKRREENTEEKRREHRRLHFYFPSSHRTNFTSLGMVTADCC